MPMLHKSLRGLNRKFDHDRIEEFSQHADEFAYGKQLNVALIAPKGKLRKVFENYVQRMPEAMRESIRSMMFLALSSKPPKPMSFSWSPAYEFELTVWQPDCNITVHLKGPYPDEYADE